MDVDAAKLIWDAQQASQRIERFRFIQGKDFVTYQSDELLRSSIPIPPRKFPNYRASVRSGTS